MLTIPVQFYNQTVQSFTATSGTYENNTFVICVNGNGIGAGQIQPSTSTSTSTSISYDFAFPSNVAAAGDTNSALLFILNENNGGVNQEPPYYFLVGTTKCNLWLYSLTPAANASSFSASNINNNCGKVGSFDYPIASLLYYSPLNLLFVADGNGSLYTYSVTWSSSNQPSFSYQGVNTNYGWCEGATLSLTLFNQPTVNLTNATNQFGQFIPAGNYQNSSSDISITINAQCPIQDGTSVPSSLTFTTEQAATISNIYNANGSLEILTPTDSASDSDDLLLGLTEGPDAGLEAAESSGMNSAMNSVTPSNQLGVFIPAGSYQDNCSDISITINAQCSLPDSTQVASSLTFTPEQAAKISNISNNNGVLTLELEFIPYLIVTGLTQGGQSGSFYFPISSANNGILPNATGVIWNTNFSVATVVDYQNQLIYTATQGTLVSTPFDALDSTPTTIWNAGNENPPQLILSLAASSNPNNVAPQGEFSQGALFMGTVPISSCAQDNTMGSIYTYDPTSSSNGGIAVFQDSIVDGSPYSVYADQNLHLLVNAGSTGLYYYSVSYNESAPESAALIPNNIPTASSGPNIGRLLALITLEYVLIATAEIDPIALGLAVATLASTV